MSKPRSSEMPTAEPVAGHPQDRERERERDPRRKRRDGGGEKKPKKRSDSSRVKRPPRERLCVGCESQTHDETAVVCRGCGSEICSFCVLENILLRAPNPETHEKIIDSLVPCVPTVEDYAEDYLCYTHCPKCDRNVTVVHGVLLEFFADNGVMCREGTEFMPPEDDDDEVQEDIMAVCMTKDGQSLYVQPLRNNVEDIFDDEFDDEDDDEEDGGEDEDDDDGMSYEDDEDDE